MPDVITRDVGDFRLTLRPGVRSLTMAGRGRVERVAFDEAPRRLAFYRFLVECSRTGEFYLGDVAAWDRAVREVARLRRRNAA